MLTRRHWLLSAAALAAPAPPPNVLLINSDDQRWDTIRALGNPEISTPNLDNLVRRGFVFRNYYCQGSLEGAVCQPSRTMLMTGKTLFRIPGRRTPPDGVPLLPKAFEAAGYATFHAGKKGNTYLPASQAFQQCLFSEDLTPDRAQQSAKHADAFLGFLEKRQKTKPFFAYLAPPVPHDPRIAEDRFMKMYDPAKITLSPDYMERHPFDNGEMDVRDERLAPWPRTREEMQKQLAEYYACVTCLDFHIGRILQALETQGLLVNTYVIFTSDQGLAVGGRHGLMGKQNLYEHFKAPLIFTGPGIKPGMTNALAYVHDMFPTLAAMAQLTVPPGVEGTSLLPIIHRKEKAVRSHLFGAYKDVQRMVRDARWKLIWYPKINRYQLFDLQKDPDEIRDLAADPKEKFRIAAMKKQLAAMQEDLGDKAAPRPS
jgi:arylsulfatase A-like enzyme